MPVDLGEVADAAEEAVGDAGGATGAFGDGLPAGFIYGDAEDGGGSADDVVESFVVVEAEVHDDAKSVAEGASEISLAGGGADDSEGGDIEADAARGGALADHDVNFSVFHGGVEDFFDLAGEAVDLVDEQDGTRFEIGEDSNEVSGSDDGGAGGDMEDGLHFGSDDVGKGGFTESGGAVKEKMIERFFALFGGLKENTEIAFDIFLPNEFGEATGTEGELIFAGDLFGVDLVVAAHTCLLLLEVAEGDADLLAEVGGLLAGDSGGVFEFLASVAEGEESFGEGIVVGG